MTIASSPIALDIVIRACHSCHVKFRGDRLREARVAARLTQEALGQRVGKQPFQISNYERGRNEPRPAAVAEIARATGKPLEFFFGDDADEEAALAASLMWAVRRIVDNAARAKAVA